MEVVFEHPQHFLNKTIDFSHRSLTSSRFKQPAYTFNYVIRAVAVIYRVR